VAALLGQALQGQQDWDTQNWDSFVIVFAWIVSVKMLKIVICVWYFALDETRGDFMLVGYTLDGVRNGCRTCVDDSKV